MLLRQMQYFVSVVECQSFTEAAEQCFISQSAISQQIKALEEDIGVPLLKREHRRFVLTPAGDYFYRHAREVLTQVQHIKEETRKKGAEKISLKIGYLRCYGAIELHHAIAQYAQMYPQVSLSLIHGSHEELYDALRFHQVDLIISDQRRAFQDDYYNYELLNSDCFVEVSINHALAHHQSLTKKDLRSFPCILIASQGQQFYEQEYYQKTLGFSQPFLFAENLEEGRLMVAGQQGFLPIEAIGTLPPPSQGIIRLPLYHKNQPLKRKYCAFWYKETSNVYIEAFADLMHQLLHQDS